MNGQIFISYRRNDSRAYAGRIHDRLTSHFSKDQIFMDVDNIEPGMDFVEAIETAISKCDVLIAVIGEHWLSASDKNGARMLENPEDYVRLEIATALKRNIRVIPVLLDDTLMPLSGELPEELKPLTRRQSLPVNHTSFSIDVERLLTVLGAEIARNQSAPAAPKTTWTTATDSRDVYRHQVLECLKQIDPAVSMQNSDVVKFSRPGTATHIVWAILSLAIVAIAIRDIWVDEAKEILPYHWWFLVFFGFIAFFKLAVIKYSILFNLVKDEFIYDGIVRPVKKLGTVDRVQSSDKKTTTWKVSFRNDKGKLSAEEKLFAVDNSLNKQVVTFFLLLKEFHNLDIEIPIEW